MSEAALAPSAAAKGSLKGSAIQLAVVLFLGACAGGAFEALRSSSAAAPGFEKPAESPASPTAQPSTIVDLPPIVTNLVSPRDTWARLEGSIVFDPKTLSHPEAVAAQIGDDALAYLRTVTLRELEGPIGLENIRQDLNDRASIRSGGKVRAFVIRTLVVQ